MKINYLHCLFIVAIDIFEVNFGDGYQKVKFYNKNSI